MFITLEGIDGSGKTTQLKLLQSWLNEQGRNPVVTREPGGTVLGERIRSLLLSPEDGPKTSMAELLLYVAARAELVETIIQPALETGELVIADRFSDSTWAYQVWGRGLEGTWIGDMLAGAIGGLKPDLTLLFDLEPSVALSRTGRGDRLEQESLEFFERVRQGYLALADKEPNRVRVIAAKRDMAAIWDEVRAHVSSLL
ncbi:MAG: dTMP kinase [bacterium]